MKVPSAITIAGSDSGGGAGIQADLKTFLALGVHGMSAICALTAQNTKGVSAVHEVPPEFVREQISQVATDFDIAAAKTGMLSSPAIVEAVADAVKDYAIPNLVVDPVFVSKNEDVLLSEDSIDSLKRRLLPLATVVTPNLHEAAGLTGRRISDLSAMREAAKALHALGPRYVLVKGGHLDAEATDVLFDGESFVELTAERIESQHTHGTGCTLSAAIAAGLALGLDVGEAVRSAKEYVTGAIRHGLEVGKGYGPTNHGWASTMREGISG
ncbi:MAG TPA: bifunctional hydroxymethylpyrimidine kinase/phosphomethylpyrimidine kinase [Actinomycetota bacterium]|nr:bifunctional hydroxymethylpyrimidine kinase/phosphomethylpyrimidine kinase [Actinomycetota bacterium]